MVGVVSTTKKVEKLGYLNTHIKHKGLLLHGFREGVCFKEKEVSWLLVTANYGRESQ